MKYRFLRIEISKHPVSPCATEERKSGWLHWNLVAKVLENLTSWSSRPTFKTLCISTDVKHLTHGIYVSLVLYFWLLSAISRIILNIKHIMQWILYEGITDNKYFLVK